MIVFKHIEELQHYLNQNRAAQKTIGFVPTMGALHQGHISLVSMAKHKANLVVSSIFVNPTQFNDPADFKKYPVTIDKDINLLEAAGCDVLFLPSVPEMYPGGLNLTKHYDLGYLETILDGAYRPGHFQGVCQVVERLLDIVQPNQLFLGQKDYQQCLVLKRLITLMHSHTEIVIAPTQREPDGLAMSSRNLRLNPAARARANTIFQTLTTIKKKIVPGPVNHLKEEAMHQLQQNGFTADYVEIANAHTLQLIDTWDGKTPLVALAAAFIDNVRLIDNIIL